MKATGAILGLAALAGVSVVGGAWYTGQQMQARVQQGVQEVNAALARQHIPDVQINLALESLEHGLFNSVAYYRLRIQPDAEAPAQDIRFVDHIEHGPFPRSQLTAGQLKPVLAVSRFELINTPLVQGWFTATSNRTPLSGRSVYGYDGTVNSSFQLAPARVSQGVSLFEFSGLQLDAQAGKDLATLKLNGKMERLSLAYVETGKAMQLQMDGLTLRTDHRKGSSGLMLGDSQVDTASLSMRAPGTPPVELRKLSYTDHSEEQGNLLSSSLRQEVGTLSVGGHDIGSLRMGFSVGHLDAGVVSQLGELLSDYAEVMGREGDAPLQQQQLLAAVEQLLAGNPQVRLDELALRTASGEGKLAVSVDLARPAGWGLEEPEALLDQLVSRLQLQVDVDKGMIRDLAMLQAIDNPSADPVALKAEATQMAEMASGMAVGMQLASLQGERLSTRLDYQGGMIDFNGRRMPAEQFVYMLQEMRNKAP